MLRKLLILVSATSLLFYGLTVLLWATSATTEHRYLWTGRHGNATVGGSRGLILFWLAIPATPAAPRPGQGTDDDEASGFEHQRRKPPTNVYDEVTLWLRPGWRCGPVWAKDSGPGFIRYRYLIAPAWMVAGAFLIVPVTHLLVWAIRRRIARRYGLCRACGYDLRGNVSGTCPECGTAVADEVPHTAGLIVVGPHSRAVGDARKS